MNRRIQTNVLNGFIQQAISHNKYLEEREMWSKREEQSANDFPSRSKHKKSKHKRKHKHKNRSKDNNDTDQNSEDSDDEKETEATNSKEKKADNEEIDDLKAILALYKDAKEFGKAAEPKWDHSGYLELYKNETIPSTSRNSNICKYSDDEAKNAESKRRKRSEKRKESDSEVSKSSDSSESSEDEHRKKKRKKKRKHRHSKTKRKSH